MDPDPLDKEVRNSLTNDESSMVCIDDTKSLKLGFRMNKEYTFSDMRPNYMVRRYEKIAITIINIIRDSDKNRVIFTLNRESGIIDKMCNVINEYVFIWDQTQNVISTKNDPSSFFYATLFFKNKPRFSTLD
ncbi:putative ORFan [Tupanvirus deep ocean]|uniref:ORFan n=2 Tax=Tupanvirus TaxID=2094720 RepID=A0AC62A700_9VIRU|nr:putative ORFan [Tupanvirus deep ocean]QKU33556.1 putative ORFan [Tupanvirus deep ocean]